MLVLSRQRDETIMIGDEIEITVVDIRGDKVRLGINAPTRIAVHRKEVYEAIRRENEQAARLAGPDVAALGAVLSPGPPRASGRDPRPPGRTARLLAEQATPPPPRLKPTPTALPAAPRQASAT
ncbi:MAG: carbon storage regulator CsrA [Phycisphaerae bacterium]|nr:carbon storage regulator CsrA [Phycisphaerae bacterium]